MDAVVRWCSKLMRGSESGDVLITRGLWAFWMRSWVKIPRGMLVTNWDSGERKGLNTNERDTTRLPSNFIHFRS